MDRYIFARRHNNLSPDTKGFRLTIDDGEYSLYNCYGESYEARDRREIISDDTDIDNLLPYLLKLDTDLLKTAFLSSHFANWLSDKRAEQAEDGSPAHPGLKKSSETLIMYLVELGVSTTFLLQCIYGDGGNKYMEFKYLVQEFGKMI